MKRPFLAPFHPVTNPVGIIIKGSVYDFKRYYEMQSDAVRRLKELEDAGAVEPSDELPQALAEPQEFPALQEPAESYEPQEPQESSESLFIAKTANEWLDEALRKPDPGQLWYEFWNEGELSCLFADSNAGKSILAVQIAREVAEKMPTLYFDFEMSSKQFQKRYTDAQGNLYRFPENFIRMEMNPAMLRGRDDIENVIMSQIRREIVTRDAKVAIIDNLGFICTQSEQGDAAGRLMRQLKEIQSITGVSMLVIGHTPKRDMTTPLTQNELAGSKRLFNFFDSVFAIGQSARDPSLRYLKQLKVRAAEFTYTSENVLTCEIVKEDNFIRFVCRNREPEIAHLKIPDMETLAHTEERIVQLHKEGKTLRQIAGELNLSFSRVQRYLKSRAV